MKLAEYWHSTDEGAVQCELCPEVCRIAKGECGGCRIRCNQDGKLYATTYGRIASAHLDPIEKKPLYHFFPGEYIFSIGSIGCNLHCNFCQNYTISQTGNLALTTEVSCEHVVQAALGHKQANLGLCYTYNEPLIQFEFVRDCARLVREAGAFNVLVTNGYINPRPLEELLPLVDAANVDLKAHDDAFYHDTTGGRLQPVLRTIKTLFEAGVHVEVTNLLVTGENDSLDQVKRLVEWMVNLSPDLPLHFSRYFPAYQATQPPTPLERLEAAWTLARESLHYVYLGNVSPALGSDTYCPECGALLIDRQGYSGRIVGLKGDTCAACGRKIPGRFRK